MFLIRCTDESGYIRNRSQQTDQCRNIINSEIHTDSGTGKPSDRKQTEKNIIISVNCSGKPGNVSEHSLINRPSGRLQGSAKKGIRSTAQPQSFFVGMIAKLCCCIKRISHCLFCIDMLPGSKCSADDLFVRAHRSEINNHLNLRIRHHVIYRACGESIPGCLFLSLCNISGAD